MVTLFDGLRTAVNTLKSNATALAISQTNLTHVGAKGYARQIVGEVSAREGGAQAPQIHSARSDFAEQTVWSRNTQRGFYQALNQSATGLDELLGLNDIGGASRIHGAMASLFRGFSALQANPGSAPHQQDAIQQARSFALTLSQTAQYIGENASMTQDRIQRTVERVNTLVASAQRSNVQISQSGQSDLAAEANLYASLEELSGLVPITVQRESNGALTVLLNGQTPLLQGTNQFPLSVSFQAPAEDAEFPDGPSSIRIAAPDGRDVTDLVQGGELAGLIDHVNRFLPSLTGNSQQAGALNRVAKAFADSVNAAIGGSQPLFEYGADPLNAARSLKISSDFQASDLADTLATDPDFLARIGAIVTGLEPANQIDGESYSEFMQNLTAKLAAQFEDASDGLDLHGKLMDQAISLRESIQGATIEQEAVEVLEYQRIYQAAARMISVIDELVQTTIGLGS